MASSGENAGGSGGECEKELSSGSRWQWWRVVNNILLVKCESCWGKPHKYVTVIKKWWAHAHGAFSRTVSSLLDSASFSITIEKKSLPKVPKVPWHHSLWFHICVAVFPFQFSFYQHIFKVHWCPWAAISLETILLLVVEFSFIRHPAQKCEHLTEDNSTRSLLPGLIFFS